MEKRAPLFRLMAVVAVVVLLLAAPSFLIGRPSAGLAASLATSGRHPAGDGGWTDFWVVRLILNLLGYATIVVPGYLVIRFVKKTKYLNSAGNGCLPNLLRMCVHGSTESPSLELGPAAAPAGGAPDPGVRPERSLSMDLGQLAFCSFGLLGSYLVWGLLQERIMSHMYGDGVRFRDSQFLVFMNRILALVIGALVVLVRPQRRHTAPIFKYSYSSFSNIMSSWCQYEALKFVSFPTQVLAKASKVIPVMLMGRLVSRRSFEYHEYATALMISVGVSMFVLTSKDTVQDDSTVTTLSGVVLLCGYLFFDAFTSNWQGELYRSYGMSPIQMMLGVNLFSVLFTSTTLLEQGALFDSLAFMMRYPVFMGHVVLLSICSASGQLFIFHTIDVFGPVTFTIIMTIRQGLAILLSCIIYGHPVTVVGAFGIIIIFVAIFARTYLNQVSKKRHAKVAAASAPSVGPPSALQAALPGDKDVSISLSSSTKA